MSASSTSHFENASTTEFTTGAQWFTSLSNSGLGVDANGKVYAAPTSTLATISGTLALTQLANQNANTVLANATAGSAAPTAIATSSFFGTGTAGQVLAWNAGVPQWIATTTLTNGTGISTTYSATNNQWTITNTGALFGYPFTIAEKFATSTSATTTSISTQGVFFASSTAAASQFPFASSTALSATTLCLSTDCRTAWPTSGGSGDPFPTHTSYAGQTTSATTSTLWLTNTTVSLAASSSVLTYASSTALTISGTASTSLFFANGLSTCTSNNVLTWTNGTFGCEADDTAVGTANPFTWEDNYAVVNAATTSILWAKNGLNASSTSHFTTAVFDIASSTNASSTFLTARTQWFTSLSNSGLGVDANGKVYAAATTTFSTGLTYASGAVTCDTASGSALGCVSSADWNTFNNKQAAGNYITALTGDVTASGPGSASVSFALGNTHWWTARQNFGNASTSQFTATSSVWFTSLGTPAGTFLAVDPNGLVIATTTPAVGGSGTVTNIATTYPIIGGPITTTGTLSLAFGTTTTNTWTHQIFSSLFATNASSTNATTTNLHITGLSNSALGVDANGKVYAAATSTLANISGILSIANGGTGGTTATGATNILQFLASGTGAAARSLTSKFSDTVSIKDFGAVCDGVTDDRAAIIAADAAAVAAGRALYFPGGYCLVSAAITPATGATWVGSGYQNTHLMSTSATADILDISNGFVTIDNFDFQSTVTRTSGYFINVTASNVKLKNLTLFAPATGIRNSSTGGVGFFMQNISVSSAIPATGISYQIESCTDCFFYDIHAAADTNPALHPNAHFLVKNATDITCYGCSFMQAQNVIWITPTSGESVSSLKLIGGYADSASQYGVLFNPQGTGSVLHLDFTNFWAYGTTAAILAIGNGTNIDGITFTNTDMFSGALGADFVGAKNISFINSKFGPLCDSTDT